MPPPFTRPLPIASSGVMVEGVSAVRNQPLDGRVRVHGGGTPLTLVVRWGQGGVPAPPRGITDTLQVHSNACVATVSPWNVLSRH